jgi:hypothetical protein
MTVRSHGGAKRTSMKYRAINQILANAIASTPTIAAV